MPGKFATYPSLQDSVFLVSGGASGIGADIVRAAHGQKAKVAFLDLDVASGEALAKELPGSLFLRCDLMQTDSIAPTVQRVREALGPVRVLVNNAANDDRKPVDEVTPDYWDWSMDVNLKHQFFLAQAVLPHMKELGSGSIINLSSIAWRFGADTMLPYATAKSAVIGLTRGLARNFGPFNIRVNAIEPGAVMTEKQLKLWYPKQEQVDAIVARQMIRRMLKGEEIARTVLFLASDDSQMITKQSFIVDAGLA
jgi:NAD(P)-dependent dehydrogenase (short-subunit alcohol dehydrogenase family)